jgi:HSP20 family molecular chaperone IbpA
VAGPEIVSGGELGDFASNIREAIARRAYELFEAGGYQDGRDLEDWLRAESELLHPVEVKTWESEREVYVTAEMPGFRGEEVKIGVKPRRVIIWGKSTPEQGRSEGHPRRTPVALFHPLDLPAEIDPSKTSARLANGILKLELPKVVH